MSVCHRCHLKAIKKPPLNKERIEKQAVPRCANSRLKRDVVWAVQGDLISHFCTMPRWRDAASAERIRLQDDQSWRHPIVGDEKSRA